MNKNIDKIKKMESNLRYGKFNNKIIKHNLPNDKVCSSFLECVNFLNCNKCIYNPHAKYTNDDVFIPTNYSNESLELI